MDFRQFIRLNPGSLRLVLRSSFLRVNKKYIEGRGCAAPPFSSEAIDFIFGDLVPDPWGLNSCLIVLASF